MKALKYLHEKGCPWDKWTCYYAARGGHLEVLKYAHEKGCPWHALACIEAAAEGGHLGVLKYLHEKMDCPFENEDTCMWAAARAGSLEVLKYLHENGCPWGDEEQVRRCVCAYGSRDMVAYVNNIKPPIDILG